MSGDNNTKEKRGLSIFKIIGIVISVFTIMPLLIFGGIYSTNKNFQYNANKYLQKAPGAVGQYFESIPTKEEREVQKDIIANYFNTLDINTASDKLTIIQKEDEELYSDLIKKMISIDKGKTNDVLENMRNKNLKKDILIATIEEIDNELENSLRDRAKYYENLSRANVVKDIESQIENKEITYENMAKTIGHMKDKDAIEILNNFEKEEVDKFLQYYDSEKKMKFLNELAKVKNRKEELLKYAKIYNAETAQNLVEIIGNTKKYKINELSTIYRNMDVKKSGEVIAFIEDKEFIYELLNQMKNDEILEKNEDTLTPSLMEAVKIYTEYNERIGELERVYSKMAETDIANIIEKLYRNRNGEKIFQLENGQVINISDKEIAISLLGRLKQQTIGNVLANLDTSLASDISKGLALPN
ncbi:MAG: hypothetical protein N4A57_15140 [Anaeromicrobium sp.]|jgi:flagellar motility protein MotE (MotC chaperone)|uniref:hypothetical protein n=1 Tax=Anaeromicrobium sp. TaxID=1929132 RepID=UPI0025E67D35|nr:hypothetical protein [Anaeromicrobium sp.]MCT4595582.1 hypothetical protein [Anaeromicrobium sp.]